MWTETLSLAMQDSCDLASLFSLCLQADHAWLHVMSVAPVCGSVHSSAWNLGNA